jgi:CHAT domain-containing protein
MQETALVQEMLEQEGWEVEGALSHKGEGLSLVHLATHGYYEGEEKSGIGDPYEALLSMGLDLGDRKINALELSQMNCRDCELVVLSACHSGIGQVVKDEGVYGLQRAFKMAGAQYVLVSLRELDDRTTKILMANFYRFWLKEGLEIPLAFRRAQSLLYERFRDPEIWAAWVLIE